MINIRRKCYSNPMFGTPTDSGIMEGGANLSRRVRKWWHDTKEDASREWNQKKENSEVSYERATEDAARMIERAVRNANLGKDAYFKTTGDKIADSTRYAGRKVSDSLRHAKHEYQDLSDNYAQEHGHSLERDLAIGGAAVAAVGAGGYAAYKAWKKKQAKKKAVAAQAEDKFKK